jgi:hypothetical protein
MSRRGCAGEAGRAFDHLETSPPTGPESVQHNPQEPVAPMEAQATRRVLLENRKLVAKRISACRAARVRKLQAIKAKRATKRELIVVATMISPMAGIPVFSDRTEFSVTTRQKVNRSACFASFRMRVINLV